MPRGDGTGIYGNGPMTGRAMGFCAGNDVPGYLNGGSAMGFGRGRGRGLGRGYGFGNGFRSGRFYDGAFGNQESYDVLTRRIAMLERELERTRALHASVKKEETT